MRRLRRRLATAALVALLIAPAAQAEVTVSFDRPSAAPGQPVEVSTSLLPPGTDASEITVYLLSLDVLGDVVPRDGAPAREPEVGPGVTLLGALGRAEEGVGKLTFVMPSLPPGRYTTAVWCLPCGGTLTTSYDATSTGSGTVLQVVAAAPPPAESSSGFGRIALILTILVLAAAIGAGALLHVRRRRPTPLPTLD